MDKTDIACKIKAEIQYANKRLDDARPHDTLLRDGYSDVVEREEGRIEGLLFALDMLSVCYPITDWHEDDGNCLWWKFPIMETPYVGSPLCLDFPKNVTHFTKLIEPNWSIPINRKD